MRLWARPKGGREPGHLSTTGATHLFFFPPKDPAAPGSPTGSGTGPRPRPGGRSGGPDAARGGFQPGGGAPVARRRYCAQELGGGWDPTRQGCGLTLRPPLPPAASSPPGGGPGSLPGLPAPIGVNGFGPLTPQTNGQPGSDSLYNNGLSPYPGGPSALPKSPRNGVGSAGGGGGLGGGGYGLGKGLLFPCCLSQRRSTSPPACLHRGPRAPLSPAQSPGVADPLQQAYAGMHHYAGFTWRSAAWGV